MGLVNESTIGPFVGSRFLLSGLLVETSETGVYTAVTCDWLVRVPSGNPEPDFPEDLWRIVPCGAKVRRHPDYPERNDATMCEHGHDRLPNEIELAPGGPAWVREMQERAA